MARRVKFGDHVISGISSWQSSYDVKGGVQLFPRTHGGIQEAAMFVASRRVTLVGIMSEASESALNTEMDDLAQRLVGLGVNKLYNRDDDSRFLNAKLARYQETNPALDAHPTQERRFSIEFVCHDPFWYAASETLIRPSLPVTDVALQLAADQITGLVDGDSVSTWADLSGNGFDASQATTTQQPTFQKNELNGLPVVRFDGSNDFLEFSGGALDLFRNIGGAEIFVVWKSVASGLFQYPFFASQGDSSSTPRAAIRKSSGDVHQALGTRTDAQVNEVIGGSAQGIGFIVTSAAFDWANAILTLYKDGVQDAQKDPFQDAGNTTDTGSVGITIGANADAAFPLDGDIAEILVYQRVLSTAERDDVTNYLKNKWLGQGFLVTDGQTLTATNNGGIETPPRFEVSNTSGADITDTIRFRNETLGLNVAWTGTIANGDTLIIDHAERTIRMNGFSQLNGLSVASNFFQLARGVNQIDYGGATGLHVNVFWRERWAS